MRKLKMLLLLLLILTTLESCAAVALGAGAAIGGYTCVNTSLCDGIKK